MTKQEITEGNKLIAEFMGFTKPTNGRLEIIKVPIELELKYRAIHIAIKDLKYHSSWDWLMPVVEKIESELYNDLKFCVNMAFKECVIAEVDDDFYVFYQESESKIKAVWKAVVQFIDWYNINHKRKIASTKNK